MSPVIGFLRLPNHGIAIFVPLAQTDGDDRTL